MQKATSDCQIVTDCSRSSLPNSETRTPISNNTRQQRVTKLARYLPNLQQTTNTGVTKDVSIKLSYIAKHQCFEPRLHKDHENMATEFSYMHGTFPRRQKQT